MRDIANAKQFPVIDVGAANGSDTQNYEELSTENAGIGKEVPCHVPDFINDSVPATVLPIPMVDFPVITKDDAVTAFRNYVSSKWCLRPRSSRAVRTCSSLPLLDRTR